MSLKKYKLGNFKRFIAITCLVTFLFLPFSRPKKADAFAWVIPPLALEGVKIAGGALLTFLGLEFATKAHAELFGENFAEKAAVGLVYKIATGDGFSWVPGSSMTSDLWNNWTKEVTLPQNTTDFIGDLISSLPVPGVHDGYVEMLTSGPYAVTENVSLKILEVTGSDTRIDYRLFDSSTTGGTFRYGFKKDDVYKLTLESGNACIRLSNGNLLYNFYNQDRLWFWDMKVGIGQSILIPEGFYDGVDKDKLTTTFPVGHSMDVSNATSIPLTQEQVKDVGITVEKDSSLDGVTRPITGWDWLDNILNAILDAILSIPGAIKDGIASLFIPTLSLSDTLGVLKNKLGIPTLDFPNITSKKPFEFTIDLSAIHSSYKGTVILDQPWWPITRAVVLAFEMYCIYIFAYRKITALHGGEGD